MRLFYILLFLGISLSHISPAVAESITTDILSINDKPSFQWNKEHYPHVNPDAPKGGTLRLHGDGSFDSLNPFIARGISAVGIGHLYETLGENVPDNRAFEIHGLIAEKFTVAKDKSYITFHINPKARFHDGKPITAEDVAFTFTQLMDKGAPIYKQYYASVDKVEVLSPLEVRFTFKEKNNKELPLILTQLYVLPKHYWQDKDFGKPFLTPPLGSGPYAIKKVNPGSSIEYERVKDHWAKDLPSHKGRNNFDNIIYEYYRDDTVAREAFKAGAIDIFFENVAKSWATAYESAAIKNGHIKREILETNAPHGMDGFIFNVRRPIFADVKVREAIARLFDFEWTNKAIFYDNYYRTYSYFSNTDMAALGLPSEAEKALLEPHKDILPQEVFTQEFVLPKNTGDGNIREQMVKSIQDLQKAGWTLQDGVMKNAKGEKLEFTLLMNSKFLERVILPFRKNLARIGITMHLAVVDATQYVNRVRDFDYDMIYAMLPQSNNPGNEQRNYFGTVSADTKGSRNYAGVKSPVVDALVERIITAQNREELKAASSAMDRVLLWGHYIIPGWHFSRVRVAFWDKFARSSIAPATGVDYMSWWIDPEAEKALKNSNTGYGKQ